MDEYSVGDGSGFEITIGDGELQLGNDQPGGDGAGGNTTCRVGCDAAAKCGSDTVGFYGGAIAGDNYLRERDAGGVSNS